MLIFSTKPNQLFPTQATCVTTGCASYGEPITFNHECTAHPAMELDTTTADR